MQCLSSLRIDNVKKGLSYLYLLHGSFRHLPRGDIDFVAEMNEKYLGRLPSWRIREIRRANEAREAAKQRDNGSNDIPQDSQEADEEDLFNDGVNDHGDRLPMEPWQQIARFAEEEDDAQLQEPDTDVVLGERPTDPGYDWALSLDPYGDLHEMITAGAVDW